MGGVPAKLGRWVDISKVYKRREDLIEKAKDLRNNSTLSEVLLWNKIKGKKFLNLKFSRQKPIGTYILDFFCKEKNIGIEIDGESHYGNKERDNEKDRFLIEKGIKVIRVSDKDIKQNIQGVIDYLQRKINKE